MRQSRLFTKTRKEIPRDEESKNAQLLIRAGFIHKELSGVYSFLPLGIRVLKNLENIIRREMEQIGALEIRTTALQKKEAWEKSGRWDDDQVDNWFKTRLKNGQELGLAFTHEEAVTAMMKSFISSYKDLPVSVYDIRSIFRNEERAKSGLLRGREFYWKALYSFSRNLDEHQEFYDRVREAYFRIYDAVGIGDRTVFTYALGASFSPYSHEFQTITDIGEDTIYFHPEKNIAINEEAVSDSLLQDLQIERSDLIEKRAVEVGNIFTLGDKFSRAIELVFKNETGARVHPVMGSYGIGISRLVGVVAETLSDDKGLIWPESISPFQVHLLVFGDNDAMRIEAENIYHDMKNAGIDLLFDDRPLHPGEKLADADLIGIPYRVILSERSKEQGGVELSVRGKEGSREYLAQDILLPRLLEIFHLSQ